MLFLEETVGRLFALGPLVIGGFIGTIAALLFAYRQLKRRREIAELARPFGLQPIVAAPSLLGILSYKPGLTGTFHGQAVRVTVQQARRYNRYEAFRVTAMLRLRVEPWLSSHLVAARRRDMILLLTGFEGSQFGDEALDGLLHITDAGPRDHAVLRVSEVGDALAALLDSADGWKFVRGELQLRKTTDAWSMVKGVESLLTLTQAFAAALTSQEVAELLENGSEQAMSWRA